MEEKMKFYKAKAIYFVTVIFGGCAGGLMIGINFFHMGRKRAGWCSIVLSILLMAIVLSVLILIPEHVSNAVPRYIIPIIIGGIAYWIVNRTQQKKLREVAEEGKAFYSNWKSLGIGLVGFVIAVAIGLAILGIQLGVEQKKRNEMIRYENEALRLYDISEQEITDEELVRFIEHEGLVNWDKFLGVAAEMENKWGITKEELVEINLLKDYGALRKQEYQCILNMTKDTLSRAEELAGIRERLDSIIQKLSAL